MATILNFDTYNDVSDNPYAIVFLDDGSAQQVLLPAPNTVTTVGPPLTFLTAGPSNVTPPLTFDFPAMISVGFNNSTVVPIITPLGYFIWDGMHLFQSGTASPVANVIDGGADYTSAPTVTAFGGSGTLVTLAAQVDLGSVSLVRVTNPGMGYGQTDSAILVFMGGGQGDSAYGVGVLADGVLIDLTIISGGEGFNTIPALVVTPVSGGTGANAIVTSISGGVITGVQFLAGGVGYDQGATVATSGGGGTGAIFAAASANGVVVGVTMISNGNGYGSAPDARYVSTSGSGAGGRVLFADGTVAGVAFDYPSQGGSGYETPPIVQFVGGGGPAAGTLELMPFGVKGNAIESYQNRIWIADGDRILFTAPGSIVDFGNGGGAFQSQDADLQIKYQGLKQSNGFLYLIGDSAVFYISGVNTAGTPPVTTFSYLNVDPQVGCAFPLSIKALGRRIVFANNQGVYAINGGAVEKVSMPLDDLFFRSTFDIFGASQLEVVILSGMDPLFPSGANVTLFSQPCYALLFPIVDPFTGAHRKAILMWNGQRWWTATQSANLRQIGNSSFFSYLHPYGHDGTNLYPLLTTPSTIPKTVQSRLWVSSNIISDKKSWGVYCLYNAYGPTTLHFHTDSEIGTFAVAQGAFAATGTETAPTTAWARSSASAPSGITIGFTMTSNSLDFAVLQISLLAQDPYSLRT